MSRRWAAAVAVAVTAAAGASAACGRGDRGRSIAGRDAAVAGSARDAPTAGALAPEVARLPGAIWYVVDGNPAALYRLAGGVARRIGDGLFPTGARLDGKQLAIRSKGTTDPDNEQLVVVDDGGAVTPAGVAAFSVREPAVDPAGGWVVVAANRDGHSELYVLRPAALATMTAITENPEGNFHPTALRGRAVAFASSRDGDSEIYRAEVDGTHVQRLTAFYKDDWDPVASPDGGTVAFLSDREGPARIFVMAPDGTGQRRLTDRTEPEIEEAEPAWSPDGARVAYVAQRGADRRVVVHDVGTGAERIVTPDGAADSEPAWSPDGAWLVVARARQVGADTEHDLWAVRADPSAGPPVQLTIGGGTEGVAHWVN